MAESGVYLLEYKKDTGEVAIDRVNGDLQGTTELLRRNWGDGWTIIVPFYEKGYTYLLKYSAGTAGFHHVPRDPEKNIYIHYWSVIWSGIWSTGWTSIVPLMMNGNTYLLEYKSGEGTVAIDQVTLEPDRDLRDKTDPTVRRWNGTWSTGWTNIVPFSMNGNTYLLEYKEREGTVAIDQVRSDLQGTTELWRGRWSSGWTSIVPFSMNGNTYLLEYKSGDGTVAIDRVNGDLQGTTEVWGKHRWSTGWTSIVAFVL